MNSCPTCGGRLFDSREDEGALKCSACCRLWCILPFPPYPDATRGRYEVGKQFLPVAADEFGDPDPDPTED